MGQLSGGRGVRKRQLRAMVSAAKKCQHRHALTQLDGEFGLHEIGDEAGFVRRAVNSFQGCRVRAAHDFGPKNEARNLELAVVIFQKTYGIILVRLDGDLLLGADRQEAQHVAGR